MMMENINNVSFSQLEKMRYERCLEMILNGSIGHFSAIFSNEIFPSSTIFSFDNEIISNEIIEKMKKFFPEMNVTHSETFIAKERIDICKNEICFLIIKELLYIQLFEFEKVSIYLKSIIPYLTDLFLNHKVNNYEDFISLVDFSDNKSLLFLINKYMESLQYILDKNISFFKQMNLYLTEFDKNNSRISNDKDISSPFYDILKSSKLEIFKDIENLEKELEIEYLFNIIRKYVVFDSKNLTIKNIQKIKKIKKKKITKSVKMQIVNFLSKDNNFDKLIQFYKSCDLIVNTDYERFSFICKINQINLDKSKKYLMFHKLLRKLSIKKQLLKLIKNYKLEFDNKIQNIRKIYDLFFSQKKINNHIIEAIKIYSNSNNFSNIIKEYLTRDFDKKINVMKIVYKFTYFLFLENRLINKSLSEIRIINSQLSDIFLFINLILKKYSSGLFLKVLENIKKVSFINLYDIEFEILYEIFDIYNFLKESYFKNSKLLSIQDLEKASGVDGIKNRFIIQKIFSCHSREDITRAIFGPIGMLFSFSEGGIEKKLEISIKNFRNLFVSSFNDENEKKIIEKKIKDGYFDEEFSDKNLLDTLFFNYNMKNHKSIAVYDIDNSKDTNFLYSDSINNCNLLFDINFLKINSIRDCRKLLYKKVLLQLYNLKNKNINTILDIIEESKEVNKNDLLFVCNCGVLTNNLMRITNFIPIFLKFLIFSDINTLNRCEKTLLRFVSILELLNSKDHAKISHLISPKNIDTLKDILNNMSSKFLVKKNSRITDLLKNNSQIIKKNLLSEISNFSSKNDIYGKSLENLIVEILCSGIDSDSIDIFNYNSFDRVLNRNIISEEVIEIFNKSIYNILNLEEITAKITLLLFNDFNEFFSGFFTTMKASMTFDKGNKKKMFKTIKSLYIVLKTLHKINESLFFTIKTYDPLHVIGDRCITCNNVKFNLNNRVINLNFNSWYKDILRNEVRRYVFNSNVFSASSKLLCRESSLLQSYTGDYYNSLDTEDKLNNALILLEKNSNLCFDIKENRRIDNIEGIENIKKISKNITIDHDEELSIANNYFNFTSDDCSQGFIRMNKFNLFLIENFFKGSFAVYKKMNNNMSKLDSFGFNDSVSFKKFKNKLLLSFKKKIGMNFEISDSEVNISRMLGDISKDWLNHMVAKNESTGYEYLNTNNKVHNIKKINAVFNLFLNASYSKCSLNNNADKIFDGLEFFKNHLTPKDYQNIKMFFPSISRNNLKFLNNIKKSLLKFLDRKDSVIHTFFESNLSKNNNLDMDLKEIETFFKIETISRLAVYYRDLCYEIFSDYYYIKNKEKLSDIITKKEILSSLGFRIANSCDGTEYVQNTVMQAGMINLIIEKFQFDKKYNNHSHFLKLLIVAPNSNILDCLVSFVM